MARVITVDVHNIARVKWVAGDTFKHLSRPPIDVHVAPPKMRLLKTLGGCHHPSGRAGPHDAYQSPMIHGVCDPLLGGVRLVVTTAIEISVWTFSQDTFW